MFSEWINKRKKAKMRVTVRARASLVKEIVFKLEFKRWAVVEMESAEW